MKVMNIAVKDFEVGIKTRKFQIMTALFVILSPRMRYSSTYSGGMSPSERVE
ncbi:hypothetical protein [Thermococcus sp. 101 C5]|jgi:ABC-2 type transport system permease protein|uniref:hypothetical protein n=1 Tax=Thermococcus sp. 101 C5 TaxID=2654197 RepID=UPI001562A2CA|nr:hypothetical protein [Thermococcus sp. 101 C5]